MGAELATPCPGCQRLQEEVQSLGAAVAQLQEQLAAARKDSSTSSKPPSSDIVKPPKPSAGPGAAPRRRGGQPGHAKHERAPFLPEQVTLFAEHPLHACPCCGGPLRRNGGLARVVQQVDFQQPPLTIEQHTSPEYWCEHCARPFKAALPAAIEAGGPPRPPPAPLVADPQGR